MFTISNAVLKDPFLYQYLTAQRTHYSKFAAAGVTASSPEVRQLVTAAGGQGKLLNLASWKDLDGDDEIISEGALTPGAPAAANEAVVIHRRGKAFASTDLAALVSGQDPVGEIINGIADYQAKKRAEVLIATLEGYFAANAADNDGDQIFEAETQLDAFTLNDARAKFGDGATDLTTVAMHSLTFARFAAACVGTQHAVGANVALDQIKQYTGMSVIVDDDIPYESGTKKGTIYLIGKGAIIEETCPAPANIPALEEYREALAGKSGVIARDFYACHIRGSSYKGTITGSSPTNAELKTAGNWERVWDRKAVKIMKVTAPLVASVES